MPISYRDEQMVRRTLQGDSGAYAELVRTHQTRVIAAAHHLCGDVEAAQDIAQEAFIQAYQSLAKLNEPAKFAAWLHGIVRNMARKHLARKRPQELSLERDRIPEPSTPPTEDSTDTILVLQTLPLAHREVLAARYLQEMDYEEIAQMLGITVNNARVRCFRAKQALRTAMAGAGGGASG